MDPLITVIIPIYNVEQYLHQCVDSILNQTYKNLEIILVDDGSPDNCGVICDKYAKLDERIRVIHKKNGGLSDARNAGLNIMQGEYIVFVDSDDWMEPDGINYLYQLAEKNDADLVIGGVEKVEDESGKIIWTTRDTKPLFYAYQKSQEAMKDMFLNGCASWARLYKKSVHESIRFPVGEINEDEAIVLNILDLCQKIVQTNHVVYKYRYRKQSITSTNWHKKKMLWHEHCKKNLEYISEKYPELIPYAEYRYCSSTLWCLNNMTADVKQYKMEIFELRIKLKSMLPRVIKTGLLRKKEMLRAYLILHFYAPYARLVKVLHKHYT